MPLSGASKRLLARLLLQRGQESLCASELLLPFSM